MFYKKNIVNEQTGSTVLNFLLGCSRSGDIIRLTFAMYEWKGLNIFVKYNYAIMN